MKKKWETAAAMAAYIRTRIDEEEAGARAAAGGATQGIWKVGEDAADEYLMVLTWLHPTAPADAVVDVTTGRWGQVTYWDAAELDQSHIRVHDVRPMADHIVRQDPAATLARCKMLRKLTDLAVPVAEELNVPGDGPYMAGVTLEYIAAFYRYRKNGTQHPDYQDKWAPDDE